VTLLRGKIEKKVKKMGEGEKFLKVKRLWHPSKTGFTYVDDLRFKY
jgi:hypothetical protein